MGVKLSEIITASRFTTGTGGKLSDAANTLNNTAFSDFQVSIPSITVGLGTSSTSGINVSPNETLDSDTTYRIYVAGLSTVGNNMFRDAFMRNGNNNWSLSISTGTDLVEFSLPAYVGDDLRVGRFTTSSSATSVEVTATYNDGINNIRSDNNTWNIDQVSIGHNTGFMSFTWDGLSYSGDQEILISNSGNSGVTVNYEIVGEDAFEFTFSGPESEFLGAGDSSSYLIGYSSGTTPSTDSATFRSVVDGNVEATTVLEGTREDDGGGDDPIGFE